MTPQPTSPRTAAGRALLDESAGNTYGPDERELFADDILAIEAEAAAEPTALLRACGEDWPGDGGWHLLSCDASEPHWPTCEAARAYLEGQK